eukprot:6177837-Pleurochrysis_carterae.AAC.6
MLEQVTGSDNWSRVVGCTPFLFYQDSLRVLPGWFARSAGKQGCQKLPIEGYQHKCLPARYQDINFALISQYQQDILCALPVLSSFEDLPHTPCGFDKITSLPSTPKLIYGDTAICYGAVRSG